MSNFVCPHCGMTNIDCGENGHKTPKEIELEEVIKQQNLLLATYQQSENEAKEIIAELEHTAEELKKEYDILNDSYEELATIINNFSEGVNEKLTNTLKEIRVIAQDVSDSFGDIPVYENSRVKEILEKIGEVINE